MTFNLEKTVGGAQVRYNSVWWASTLLCYVFQRQKLVDFGVWFGYTAGLWMNKWGRVKELGVDRWKERAEEYMQKTVFIESKQETRCGFIVSRTLLWGKNTFRRGRGRKDVWMKHETFRNWWPGTQRYCITLCVNSHPSRVRSKTWDRSCRRL